MAAPLKITRNATLAEGGHRAQPWVVEPKIIEDKEFIVLLAGDRKLARACGLDMNLRAPWSWNGLLDTLIRLRDDHVDDLIHKSILAKDPEGDADCKPAKLISGRAKAYHEENVPQIITVEHPAFTTDDGDRVPLTKLQMISTPKRVAAVTIGFDEATVKFLFLAAQACQREKVSKLHERPEDLPSLESKCCKWRRKGDRWMIVSRWRDADGQWKLRSEVVNVAGNEEVIKIRVKEVEEKLLEFYAENHVEPLEDDVGNHARAPHYSELSSD